MLDEKKRTVPSALLNPSGNIGVMIMYVKTVLLYQVIRIDLMGNVILS